MTKEELNRRTDMELTPTENALINFNIYYNEEHIEYYMKFHLEEYQWCYDYLMKNRHLLTIKHTPNGRKSIAKRMIKAAKSFYR